MFELTEEQKMVKSAAREFVVKEVIPIAKEIDKEDRYPKEIVKKLVELGFFGMAIQRNLVVGEWNTRAI